MQYPEDTENKDNNETTDNDKRHLVLDGTANLDYPEEEQVPRIKGLIELLNLYFGKKQQKR